MTKNKIQVDYLHSDRFSDEITSIGTTCVELREVMNGKLAQTAKSTARAFDSIVSINKDGNSVGKARL